MPISQPGRHTERTEMLDPKAYRHAFTSLNGCCHLISNSLGAMPDRAVEYASEYARIWRERGVRAWTEDWWTLPRTIGDMIGGLMNADPDTVSMHINVSSAQATIQSCYTLDSQRNKVVMMEMEFPSVLYVYREWLRDRGELVVVPTHDGITMNEDEVIDAIDDRTLLVPISHVLFRSSYIMDVRRVVDHAHRIGALVVLDVFQSLGNVPVDVKALDIDFAVGGCLKWLCGGPGAGFLYVRPELQYVLRPRLTGWLAHERPFEFDTGPIAYTNGSYRFHNGTPNIPALYTCRAGLEIVTNVGVESIRERSQVMTGNLAQQAMSRGWALSAPRVPSRRAGTIAIDVPHAREVAAELLARNVLVDHRPKAGIRISPHFYNTDDEIERVVNEIDHILRDDSWRRHTCNSNTVT